MSRSKFFVVAVEGLTATDGRKIERSWIEDIAGNYNRATYGARVNLEHIRGFTPDGPFKAYGDVLAVEKREITVELNGKSEKRLALAAQIEPTDELVAMTKAKQKIFTSIEVAPNFSGSGKAYLVGLAATDSPASLATDILEFSAKQDDPAAAALRAGLDSRKTDKANLFSAAYETAIEFEDAPAPSLKDQLTAFFAELGLTKKEPETPKAPPTPQTADTAAFNAAFEAFGTKISDLVDGKFTKIAGDVAAIRADHDKLKSSLDSTENHNSKRPPVDGSGAAFELTDC